jgi:hypothetical protein
MPSSDPASLAELATALGESLFAWDADAGILRIHGGAALGLPAEAVEAGRTLLAGLDEAGRGLLRQRLAEPSPGELELTATVPGGVAHALQIRLAPAGPGGRLGRICDVSGQRQLERSLRILHERSAPTTGRAYLEAVVQSMAEALGVAVALVGRLAGQAPELVHTEALWMDGRLAENLDYPLAGTPCEAVLSSRLCLHESGVARSFPQDRMLAELGIESYLGVPASG